ncbi:DUF342 domain-containing protein [Ureibacillus manganicus]|uniref:Flagellar Assembly Protein A N-terminal region domain-containing protein n=1 Tax=Ureibacillus manganicus DSM 26584 TaxID=1384049 RepID=A0A0A3I0N1_9BACL|nr:FapA family protein [Ureibacillus manganicus]KGR78381.1 hypothetical protein CD29_11740 [Ureibacillus manganicus DSM 26584]
MLIFSNEFINIIEENGKVFIQTIKVGFPIKNFQEIINTYPQIKLTNFALLKKVLSNETSLPVEIGKFLPLIEIEVAIDKLSASIYINESKETIMANQDEIRQKVNSLLQEKNIKYGLLPIDFTNIEPGKSFVVAKGEDSVKGKDATVRYLEIPERKPLIREDGRADFFDMNFIFEISEGDWLGEKISAESGTPGRNIFGEDIPAPPGKDIPLKYDPKTAFEVKEAGKIILRAKSSGVIDRKNGTVSISKHLIIAGDVGFDTGNIQFDGSISIRGTVQNGFSVVASRDISIEHLEGVNGAKLIMSTEGDIFIRGGIFGLGKTRVEAKNNVYAKHVHEANLIAGNEIIIGSYALGSNLTASKIHVDEQKGKIIGGRAVAQYTIITAISGNKMERRTELIVEGNQRRKKMEFIQEKAQTLKGIHEEIIQISSQLNNMHLSFDKMNSTQLDALNQVKQMIEQKKQFAEKIDTEIKEMMKELRLSAKEEIIVRKEAYPGTHIQIGRKSSLLNNLTNGTFRIENGELNV